MSFETEAMFRLFAVDEDPDEKEVKDRIAAFRKQFFALHPDLNKLLCSKLKFTTPIKGDGLYLKIKLIHSTSQADLPFKSTRPGFLPVDSRAADIANFKRSVAALPQVILEAFDPEISASQLRTDYSSRHIAAREIARSKSRTLLDDLFADDIVSLGQTMPKGTQAELLLSLDRYEWRCVRAQILDGLYPTVDPTRSINLQRKVPLYIWPLDRDPVLHAKICRCIDQKLPIKLKVSIAWSSTDGQIRYLEYPSL